MKKKPVFKSIPAEVAFWEKHDLGDYYDDKDFEIIDPTPTKSKTVLLRLNLQTIIGAKKLAGEKGIKYQTMLKQWIQDGLRKG